jgi:hypothetical protein
MPTCTGQWPTVAEVVKVHAVHDVWPWYHCMPSRELLPTETLAGSAAMVQVLAWTKKAETHLFP